MGTAYLEFGGSEVFRIPVFCCLLSHSLVSDSLRPHGGVPGKNTKVSCHCLLQGIFSTQRANLCLLHLLHFGAFLTAEPLGKPCILLHKGYMGG